VKATFYKGVVLGAVTSAVVLAAAAAIAATGGNFILGQSNSATSTSGLSANLASTPALDLANLGGGPAASFRTGTAIAPFTVNSNVKVAKLNADLVDGKHASAFLPVAGKAVDSDKLDGLDSTAFQARVSGTCGGGEAIRTVNVDGTVACQTIAPHAFSGTLDAAQLPNDSGWIRLVRLNVPAGNYIANAKVVINNHVNSAQETDVHCVITLGSSDLTQSWVTVPANTLATLPLQAAGATNSPAPAIDLECQHTGNQPGPVLLAAMLTAEQVSSID
jgi:hypothetical protein